MASADEYAAWIVSNADKKGSAEFEIVAKAYKEAKSQDVPGLPPEKPPARPASIGERLLGAGQNIVGAGEAGLSALTGMAAAPVAALGAVASGLSTALSDRTLPNTPTVNKISGDRARELMETLTYRPRTEAGQGTLETLGRVFEDSKLAGMNPAQGITAGALAGPVVRQAANAVPPPAVRSERVMPGVGAAVTDVDRLRYERSQSLPVPLPMTKGMLTRDFEQQRFEKETAKDGKLGRPIRERHAELNERILQNFDAFIDETGAEAGGLRAVGQIVNEAVVTKANRAKALTQAAYELAKEKGETQAPVNVSPLLKYVEEHQPEAINAPIIQSLGAKLQQVIRPDGTTSINDVEEVRKMIVSLSGKDATNAHYGKEIKGLIDGLTEGVGGEAYKRARALRVKYAREFEDVGVIDKLLSTKPGTKDRAVAYEDVFRHSVLSGSLDDVRAIRKTLQTAGDNGQRAWKELQGQTVAFLKDEASKSVSIDERGNTVVSAAKLNRVVNELDKDGKLDFMFGKAGAQRVRDLNDAAKDVLTFPPGSVNTSGTASVLLEAMGAAAVGRLPTAAAGALQAVNRMRRSRAIQKRVDESLNPRMDQ